MARVLKFHVATLSLVALASAGVATCLSITLSASVSAGRSQKPPAPQPDADVIALVDRVLATSQHPGLKWGAIPDAVVNLKPLYEAEADRLMWFERNAPVPGVERALLAVAAAGDYGLDAGDYDVPFLTERWAAVKAGTATGPELAHFDLALSVAAARMIRAVHVGRVDPATMDWGYNVHEKKIDVTAVAREVRQGKGLGATLDALEPSVSHYARAKKTLAAYKALEKAGEPELVPELPRGRRRLNRARPGQGFRNSRRGCASSGIFRRARRLRARRIRSLSWPR